MTLEQYASMHWKKYEKTLSELSRSSKEDASSNLIDSDTLAYDFDAIVKALFENNTKCVRPKSADCALIKDNNICFIEFKRFPRPKQSTAPCDASAKRDNCPSSTDQKVLNTLNTRDIHYSIKLKIVDSQLVALNELHSLIEKEAGYQLNIKAVFIVVVNNIAEDYMLHFLNAISAPTKSATKRARKSARSTYDNKISILQQHTERYKKQYLPCGIYHAIEIWIPTELLSYLTDPWKLFDEIKQGSTPSPATASDSPPSFAKKELSNE